MTPFLELVVRDQHGSVVDRRMGQNVWVNNGRTWLRDLFSYSSFSPLTPGSNSRIAYVGFGIGGTRQGSALAAVPPMSVDYPGTNLQTDQRPSVSQLERPVRWRAGKYLAPLSPPALVTTTSLTYSTVLDLTDITYGGYTAVPLSEIGLYLYSANDTVGNNQLIAYDTYETIQKTAGFTVAVTWVISL